MNQELTFNDGELLVFVEDVRRSEPESGEVIVMGELRSHGYRVTRHQVRHAIQLSDPLNTPLQWGAGIGPGTEYGPLVTKFLLAHWSCNRIKSSYDT